MPPLLIKLAEVEAASVRGTHSLGDRVPEEVVGQTSRRLKIESDLQFSARILHYSGPLKNTGPIPPKIMAAFTKASTHPRRPSQW